MSAEAISILLVEDNPGDAELLMKALRAPAGITFRTAHVEDLEEALERLTQERFDVILLDLSLPDSQGMETFDQVYNQAAATPIVVLTGLSDEAMAVRTVHHGAQDYLVKGELSSGVLIRSIRYAIERKRLLEREREKGEQLLLAVREAHHRIKNNLQAISDLLYLELSSSGHSDPAESLRESIERIQAIALVHDLLSQEDDVATVEIRQVMERLVPMVLQSSGTASPARVSVDVIPLRLSSKRCTNLALIVNELVTNAVKHALKAHEAGELLVSLWQDCDDLVLQVCDNGPGLPQGFNLDRDSNVGLDVVRILAERDLDGCLTFRSNGGLCAEVRFAW